GGAGNDTLNGCGFIDTTKGIPDGNDILIGGAGNDTYLFDITVQKPTVANPNPPAPIPQGTDAIWEFSGPDQGYIDTLRGLGLGGISVDLFAPTQYFYLNLLTNTVESSTVAPVGPNYQLLLTLNQLVPGQVELSLP